MEVLTDRPEDRFAVRARLFREASNVPLTIVEAAPDGPGWRLRFAEVADRAAADTLRGAYLEAIAGLGDELPRGTYYWHEVVGTTVRDVNDRELGVVTDVYRVGEADVFVVQGEPFGEFDLPAVRSFVRIFAPRRGEIVADVDALDLRPAKPRPARPPRPRKATRRRPAVPAVPRAESRGEPDTGDGSFPPGDRDDPGAPTPGPEPRSTG